MYNRSRILWIGLITLLWGILPSTILFGQAASVYDQLLEANWQEYTEQRYHTSWLYPSDWTITRTIDRGTSDPIEINQRLVLHPTNSTISEIRIDFWDNADQESLDSWAAKYELGLHRPTRTLYQGATVSINDRPAMLIIDQSDGREYGRLTALVQFNNSIVRIDYLANDEGIYQQEFISILHSLHQGISEANSTIPTGPLLAPNPLKVNASSCCGWVDTNPNTYPCDGGNCTWWAKYKRPDIGNAWGNACQWRDRARQEFGNSRVGQTAQPNAIAVWQPWNGSACNTTNDVGHVAYVQTRNTNGTFIVSQMSWQQGCNTGDNGVTTAQFTERNNDTLTFIYPAGTQSPSQPEGYLETPQPNQTLQGVKKVEGWAKVNGSQIIGIELYVRALSSSSPLIHVANATYGTSRPDAGGNYGWYWNWNTASYGNGQYEVRAKAIGANGKERWLPSTATGNPSTVTVTTNNPTHPCLTALYRYVHRTTMRHVYSANWLELGAGNNEWKYEGITGYVAKTATCYVPNGVAFYRLRRNAYTKHILTRKPENDALVAQGTFTSEGILGYIAPAANAEYHTAELYRLYHPQRDDHFYTISPDERDSAIGVGFQLETSPGHIFTSLSNIKPRKPVLSSPANNSSTTNRALTLAWNDAGDPDNYPNPARTFEVKIRQVGTSWQQTRAWGTARTWSITVPAAGNYCWTAQTGDGNLMSGWATEWCVQVNNPPTATPTRTPAPTATAIVTRTPAPTIMPTATQLPGSPTPTKTPLPSATPGVQRAYIIYIPAMRK